MKIYRGNKSVVSYSFDEKSFKCRGCSGHGERGFLTARGGHGGQRQVIFLVDQCYPPVLPAHGPASCVKIIRREYGSLNQLAAELTDLVRGKDPGERGPGASFLGLSPGKGRNDSLYRRPGGNGGLNQGCTWK
jgi:hypothetical protein